MLQGDKTTQSSTGKRKGDSYENGEYDKRRREAKRMTDEEKEKILEMLDNEPEVIDWLIGV